MRVFSGVLRIHQDEGGAVRAANGDFYPLPDTLNTIPTIEMDTAAEVARARLEEGAPALDHSELVIVDPGWYGDPPAGAHLAYYLVLTDATAGISEAFFVDAHSGKILDRWNAWPTGRAREVYDGQGATTLPGTLARQEGDPPVTSPEDVNRAYDYGGDVYDYYYRAFGRDSFDDAGAALIFTVNSTTPSCPNAFWSNTLGQMVFCDGTVTDDVTAHEMTHAVSYFSVDLIYQNQSGQLNEGFSDIFGELVDLFNGNAAYPGPPGGSPSWPVHSTGPGLDTPNNLRTACSTFDDGYGDGVRWLLGEDSAAFGGAIRDMWDPTCFGHPDRANSPLQTCPVMDNGGVHSGSGIPNHAFAILVDGKSFNGQTVTGIGPIKAAAVWYRALTVYLTPAADFEDAYAALNQAAGDLIGTTPADPRDGSPSGGGFTVDDAAQVDKSLLAVEMNTPGRCGRTSDVLTSDPPTFCADRTTIFADDFEGGVNGWTVSHWGPAGPPTPYDWVRTSELPSGRTGVGWYGADARIGDCREIDESAVHSLFSPQVVLPADAAFAVLSFTHYLASEGGWDGGNVKVSVNGGPWRPVSSTAFAYNPYNAVLRTSDSSNTNPLAGQEGWSGGGGQWGTSLVELAWFASEGDTIQLRFDFGKDGCVGIDGWYLDDVEIYACPDCDESCLPDHTDFVFTVVSGPMGSIGQDSPVTFSYIGPEADSDVTMFFSASADLSSEAEYVAVDINGTPVGVLFDVGAADCPLVPNQTEIVVPAATYNDALASGAVRVNLTSTSPVDPNLCGDGAYISVLVHYDVAALDCNGNHIPDACEIDCQLNGIPDECDIAAGASVDCDRDGTPDECQTLDPGDCNCDGCIDLLDFGGLVDCHAGPGAGLIAPRCNCFDLHRDGSVDLRDCARLWASFRGW